MAKLIELEEAASLLGMTPDQVTTARTKGKLFGYRDGVNWKFKETELERFASSEGITLGEGPAPSHDLPDIGGPITSSPTTSSPTTSSPTPESSGSLPKISAVDEDLTELVDVSELELVEADDDQDSSDPDSILVSEEELGSSERNAGSTIIGREQLGDDADLILASDSVGGGSELKLASDSAIQLDDDNEVTLQSDSEVTLQGGSEVALQSDNDESGELKLESDLSLGGSDLKLAGDSVGSKILADDDVLDIAADGDDDLVLDADELSLDDDGLELSDDDLILEDDSVSSLEIDVDDDDDISLLDSDVTLNASDSGINLGSPSDSGISLENTPAELGGSGIEALELGEADFIELDDDDLDLEGGTDLKADDDFLLTSAEGGAADESESGSQVIALDEAEEFDEVGETILGDVDMLDADSLDDAAEPNDLDYETGAAAVAAVGTVAGGAAATIAAPIDAEYSILNVVGLGACLFFLSLAGIMMFDLLRNMWSWNQEYALSSSLMDAIIGLLP